LNGNLGCFIESVIASSEPSAVRETVEGPATLFFSYSHRDEELRDGLSRHLKLLERTGLIRTQHDRSIMPGDEWADAIDTHLYVSDVILLLISGDFTCREGGAQGNEKGEEERRHGIHGFNTM
jgi:hypothetical protein